MEEFEQQLKAPFLENKEKIFYRGERVDDRARPLIPTIFATGRPCLTMGMRWPR